MSLLNFRASKLYRQVRIGGDIDADGNYIPGNTEWKFCCNCNAVPAGEANKITTSDGTVDFYSYTISGLPVGIKKFEYGDFIKLEILGDEEVVLKVKGFHRYQLQCKLWV